MNFDNLIENFISLDSNSRMALVTNYDFKKYIIVQSDYFRFAGFLYLLSFEEISSLFDNDGVNLLLESDYLGKRLSGILERDDCSKLDFLSTDKMISVINRNYESLKYLLNNMSYNFVSKYFDFLIKNDIDNFIRIASCGSMVGKLFFNDDIINIVINKNLISKNSILKFNSFTISCLIRNQYYCDMILSDDFDLYDLLFNNVILDESIFSNNYFINKLVCESDVSKYRFMINQMYSNYNISLIGSVEQKRDKYYDEYVDKYLPDKQMFADYYDLYNKLVVNGKVIDQSLFFSLDFKHVLSLDEKYDLELTFFSKLSDDEKVNKIRNLLINKSSHKFLEILIDRYYKDIDINFFGDLDNVNSFNGRVNILSEDSKFRYKRISELRDNCEVDIDFYKSFKMDDYSSVFYDDVKLLQSYAYRSMLNKLTDISMISNLKGESLNGVDVYNFEGEKFYFLIHSFNPRLYKNFNDAFSSNFKKSVTSLSLINNDVLGHYGGSENVVLGFNQIDISRIVHVFNKDSFSGERHDDIFSERINKLYTPDDLMLNTVGYNEIVYYNYLDNYNRLIPSYVICFDNIREIDSLIARRFDIPIMRINTLKYPKPKRVTMSMLDTDEKYVFSYESYEEKKKLYR